MDRILLTGATGVVGRRVLPLLVSAGHPVTAVGRTPRAAGAASRGGRDTGVDEPPRSGVGPVSRRRDTTWSSTSPRTCRPRCSGCSCAGPGGRTTASAATAPQSSQRRGRGRRSPLHPGVVRANPRGRRRRLDRRAVARQDRALQPHRARAEASAERFSRGGGTGRGAPLRVVLRPGPHAPADAGHGPQGLDAGSRSRPAPTGPPSPTRTPRRRWWPRSERPEASTRSATTNRSPGRSSATSADAPSAQAHRSRFRGGSPSSGSSS